MIEGIVFLIAAVVALSGLLIVFEMPQLNYRLAHARNTARRRSR